MRLAPFAAVLLAGLAFAARPDAAQDRVFDLHVPGYDDAVVVVPARTPAPVLVATHGAWDVAEAHCDLWRRIVHGRAFVVCPRGEPTTRDFAQVPSAYYYPSEIELGHEVEAAMDAARARFGDRLDGRDPLYAGFSQGAIQGAVMLPSSSVGFARAALVEGGFQWGVASATRFQHNGGERILFVCGTDSCLANATAASHALERANVDVRVEVARGAGHTYGGPVEDLLRRSFEWLTEGDARFR